MARVNIETRWRIISQLKKGKSQRKIAIKENISQPAVRKLWLKYLETGSVIDKPKSGRPVKTTVRDCRTLCILSKRNPFKCAPQVRIEANLDNICSVRTVQRILNHNNLFGRMAAKKPRLTKKHIKIRLQWCKVYQEFFLDKWKNVIFSDECRIDMFQNTRVFVRRPRNARYNHKYTLKTVKYGGFSVMFWGAIKGDGSRILLQCPDRLNSEKYQEILSDGLEKIYVTNDIFMQDGAPCHKSASTQKFLDDNHICVLSDWPAQSPDLNIIENLWSVLKLKVRQRNVNCKDDLWTIIREEFYGIHNDVVIHLYESITKRLRKVVQVKGHNIKY